MVNYLENLQKAGELSLLAPIVGVYTIHIKGFIKVAILVMRNQAQAVNSNSDIRFKFDLKGSLIGRHCKDLTSYSNFSLNKFQNLKCILKDLDFILLQNTSQVVKLASEDYLKLMDQLKKDAAYLKRMNLIDYSMLLVVEPIGNRSCSEHATSNFINILMQ